MKKLIENFRSTLKQNRLLRISAVLLPGLVIIGLVWLIVTSGNRSPETAQTAEPRIAIVSITANGFEPATLAIEPGTKVIWTNNDTKVHQVASNPHPTHGDLPELYSEILNEGQSYEFTADKNGIFGYHDQLNPIINGTLNVN